MAGSLLTFGVTTQATDVVGYGVLKGQQKFVVAVMPPFGEIAVTNYFGRAFVTLAAPNTLANEPTLDEPGGNSDTLSAVGDAATARVYQLENPYGSPAELNAAFPDGAYTLTMMGANDGQKAATLTLGGAPTINIPAVNNSSALSAVNPKADFAVSWGAFTGGGASDFIQVRVELLSGDLVSTSPSFGAAGALDGTATSIKIPANTLPPSTNCYLVVMFAKLGTRDTTSYPGAVGVPGYFQETKLMLTTTAGSAPTDTTPPTLVSSSPADKITGVPINYHIIFTFDEAMQAAQSIAWSAILVPANFTYSWSADQKRLTCKYSGNLPANASITWKLNPSSAAPLFKDLAGNPLAADTSGSFTTGNTTSSVICDPDATASGDHGSFSVYKMVTYAQTSAAAPVEDTSSGSPADFMASLSSPTNNPVTSATLDLPNSMGTLPLSNLVGHLFTLMEEYGSQAQLDGARPNGGYTLKTVRQDSSKPSVTVSLSDPGWPPTPQIMNFDAAQAFDANADFVLLFNGIAGATNYDSIYLSIGSGDREFHAPDYCLPRPLPNTATSIVIPAGSFAVGQTYSAVLTYSRITGFDTNSIANVFAAGGWEKLLSFQVKTGGGTPPGQPKFTSFTVLANGHLELQLKGDIGRSYVIETCTDLPSWSQPQTVTIPASGTITYDAGSINAANRAFFRAKAN